MYGNSSFKDVLTSYNGQAITYDSSFNPLKYRDGINFTWRYGRTLRDFDSGSYTATYDVDAEGMRTRKYVLDKSTNKTLSYDYYYSGGQLMAMEISDGTKMSFMYDENGTPIAMKKYSSGSSSSYSLYYYITNAQGDVVGMATGSGSVVAKYKYDAWGNLLSATTGSGYELSKASAYYIQPLRYRGYVYDNESGLYYLQSRYYDPVVGRFINADNIILQNLQGANLFAYCYNNPVKYL